jgi:alkylation response protein AidB-like acyl-CoA dehydrogenase
MLSFDLDEEYVLLRNTVRSFAEKELRPLIEECEESETFPRHLFQAAASVGLLGITYPVEVGGLGLDKLADCVAREELSRVWQSFASSISAQSHLATYPIFALGTDEQKEAYLRPALSGARIGAFALTEPGSGSDVRSIRTFARRSGSDYVISGQKIFITNGTFCDYAVVVAKTEDDGERKPPSLFLVDRDTPGFNVARKLKKEGIRASETAEIFLEECRVPERALIGKVEGGFGDVLRVVSVGRIGVAANCVGIAQGAFELAAHYASEREQFGRPIGSFQAIAFKIADMAVAVEAARWFAYRAAWLYDQGRPSDQAASMAKLLCSETAVRVAKEAVHVFGGYGLMREYPIFRYLRDALVYEIGEGTSEIQRMLIARAVLGMRSN